MRKLFLDDIRVPEDCLKYMHRRVGDQISLYREDWIIVRSYEEFVKEIQENGLPDLISFDHDLADEHIVDFYKNENLPEPNLAYDDYKEKTGFDCAKWLVNHCMDSDKELPKYMLHTWNPIGLENIDKYLKNFLCSKQK